MLTLSDHATTQLAKNLAAVRERIARAAVSSGRDPDEIELVAVTKTVDVQVMCALYDLGQRRFGENRADELRRKSLALAESGREAPIDLIGSLQTNKVRHVVGVSSLIHSVDSDRLLRAIHERAMSTDTWQDILLQTNVSGEESKRGLAPDELRAMVQLAGDLHREGRSAGVVGGARVTGLMTMAPNLPNEQVRWVFTRLRSIRDELGAVLPDGVQLPQLSMGMSNDYEVAVQEGATLVRVGSALFQGVL